MNPVTPPLVQLANYGPGWAMVAVFAGVFCLLGGGLCWLLKWILEKQYATFREDHQDTRTFTGKAIEALQDIRNACDRCHADVVSTVKLEMGAATDRIIGDMWGANERVMATERETARDLARAIQQAEERTTRAIGGVLDAVRRDNDLSRPNPTTPLPVLGVGSQVRESAAPLPRRCR